METSIETIELKNVSIGSDRDLILQNCSFQFPMNQSSRLVFINDRIKYFFFHAMTQISGFHEGEYLINGKNVLEFSFEEFMQYRVNIGVGFATRGLIHNRTLRQNLELPLHYHNFLPIRQIEAWVQECAEYFELKPDLDKRPSEVSTNAQKATLILRAFVHKPQLVFLDTPDLLLSTKYHANLLQLIDDHKKHHNLKHLFFASHNEDLADCLADQNIIVNKKNLNRVDIKKLQRFVS